MNRIRRLAYLPALAIALFATSAAVAEAAVASGDDALFASLTPVENLGSITGTGGISGDAILDKLIQINVANVSSTVSAVTLGDSDAALGSARSSAAFSTGSIQASVSGLGGANAIAINTGIASSQTQSVNVNLVIGSVGGANGVLARTH